ncbi:2-methylcitrate dehydratase PrpD [Bacillus oleivorans]|uniref:2-methylcitrate dehydratase PrpD n=1 Tax=Bacillus oleivorans TaxID=1448271 RepID=A0A285D823_9BACI|nr:MmgE/PrpD family protein [Bacillus oleivorans]SNX75506.1 2-methylcitrate dehydratase PrpD [Bacillus oleivorans]
MQNMINEKMSVQLARYVVNLKFEELPEKIVDDVQNLILDYLGVALKGSTTEPAEIVTAFQMEYGTAKQEATLIGNGKKLTCQAAAFTNAVAAHSIELDDVDDLALFHYSPPIVSAALAVAEATKANGKDLIVAVTIGCDIMKRLSDAMNPDLRDRGYHTTPVCGIFGATAAVARLFGLTEDEVVNAFGIAGAHASGLMEMYGSNMQKRINPGPAAHNAIVSARLARMGYTGADTIFDGVRGVLQAFSGQEDTSALVNGLGKTFDFIIEFKRYACARPIHNAVGCALEIRPNIVNRLHSIKEMTIFRHPAWAHFHEIKRPKSIHEAQVSLNHAVAVALVDGDAFLEHFEDEWICNVEVQRLSQMLKFVAEPELPRGVSCLLRIVLESGEIYEAQVDYPKGSIQNPMSPDEHWSKFSKLAGSKFEQEKQVKIRNKVESLTTLQSVHELIELLF